MIAAEDREDFVKMLREFIQESYKYKDILEEHERNLLQNIKNAAILLIEQVNNKLCWEVD